jgi:hypothetical protein
MMTPEGVAEALGGALALLWAAWTEIRLRQQQNANATMLLQLNNEKIKEAVHSSSDDALRTELSKDVSGSSS